MRLSARQRSVILFTASQAPIALLLVIFFRIPDIPLSYRVMALVTIGLEAVLLFELIGNVVQKVRVTSKAIVVRGVLERHRLPWGAVKGLKQVLVSPMKNGLAAPTTLFLVKADEAPKELRRAEEWWDRYGPLANGRSGLGGLVKRYNERVRKGFEGWRILWQVDHRQAQDPSEDPEVSFLSLDGREKHVADDLLRHDRQKARGVDELTDETYPSFVKARGGRYAADVAHAWDTVE